MSGRLILGLLSLLQGCGGSQPMPAPPPVGWAGAGTAPLLAGVAQVDITPPPGLSLFGHGPESRVATGTRLRLRCQVFLLVGAPGADGQREAVALVPCELGQPSLLVQRTVAEKLREDPAVPLGPDRIVLMASHTHQSFAHYFGSRNLSGTFSSRLHGFDPAVVDMLASKIAFAIRAARDDLGEARIGWGYRDDLRLGRNRAMRPFNANRDLPEELRAALVDPALTRAHSRAQLATDPLLSVLRIERRRPHAWETAGVLAVYGLHPTVMPNHQELYNGDVFGFASRRVAERVEADLRAARAFAGVAPGDPEIPVGIANGIEGDVGPAVDTFGPTESRSVGRRLGDAIYEQWADIGATPGGLDAHAPVEVAYRELRFAGARLVDRNGQPRALCEVPEMGTPAGGGGGDHPTFLRAYPAMNPGVSHLGRDHPCHGNRLALRPPVGDMEAGVDFPNLAPISMLRLGQGLVATVPAEVTTVAGWRIRDRIGAVFAAAPAGERPERVTVVGLTNEYVQYVATEEEYRWQHYEGASTLYGPHTADFLAEQHQCLAEWLLDRRCRSFRGQPDVGEVTPVDYRASAVALLEPAPGERERIDRLIEDGCVMLPDGSRGYLVRWRGPGQWSLQSDAGAPRPLVIEARRVIGAGQQVLVEDDAGSSFEVRHLHGGGEANWSAVFVPQWEHGDWRWNERYVLVVRHDHVDLSSGLFMPCRNGALP